MLLLKYCISDEIRNPEKIKEIMYKANRSHMNFSETAKTKPHYGEEYFDWQKNVGVFGGIVNVDKFKEFIQPEHNVIDFGCGGGFLLSNLDCSGKKGVEINPEARKQASGIGLDVTGNIDDIQDNWADIIVSNNALEHTLRPYDEISGLKSKLKPGGIAVFILPCESLKMRFHEDDINQHLYSWSPGAIGNLFKAAGYEIIESKPWLHKWPIGYKSVYKIFGHRIFDIFCRIWGHVSKNWSQVRVIARRPKA